MVKCRWQQTSSYFVSGGALWSTEAPFVQIFASDTQWRNFIWKLVASVYQTVPDTAIKGDVVNSVTFLLFYSFLEKFKDRKGTV